MQKAAETGCHIEKKTHYVTSQRLAEDSPRSVQQTTKLLVIHPDILVWYLNVETP